MTTNEFLSNFLEPKPAATERLVGDYGDTHYSAGGCWTREEVGGEWEPRRDYVGSLDDMAIVEVELERRELRKPYLMALMLAACGDTGLPFGDRFDFAVVCSPASVRAEAAKRVIEEAK